MNRSFSSSLSLAALAACAVSLYAQDAITVDVSKPINTLTSRSIGVYTTLSDGDLLNADTLKALRLGGLDTISYPTGWNSAANAYHWSTNKLTPNPSNMNDKPYMDERNNFGALGKAMQNWGISTVIHVNYGSNAKGTGGGEPQEAAAWVAYANSMPTDGRVIGTDSLGQDWKTSGYWATMRASAPLAQDDGYNFLRISHPDPLHITQWQIGDDEPNNGYYGGDHKNSIDLHAPYTGSASENEKRKKLKELSPAFYGQQVVAFAAAMKGVDPTIQVGASLATPVVDKFAPDWNAEVLKAACKDIDFVAYNWKPSVGSLPPDYKILDDSSLLDIPATQIPPILTESIYQDSKYCAGGKKPRIAFAYFSPDVWGPMQTPITPALSAAEFFAAFIADGIGNADWFHLRDGGIYGKDGKLSPVYYGIQMLHFVVNKPGDSLVTVTGANAPIVAVGTHRRDGAVGVMLLNHNSKVPVQLKVNINGASLSGDGLRFDYGPAQLAKGSGFERSAIKTDGNSIVVSVPAYGIVDLLFAPKK